MDIRERFQINNKLISKKEFVYYLNQIVPVIEKIKTTKLGKPTFFEILIGLAFYIFQEKKVDYAVIETGMGGLMDGSNTINSADKVVVLTKIGLDHTNVLGPNLSSIATQKAGIIHKYNTCFSINQKPVVKNVFDQTAKKNKTVINYIDYKKNILNIKFKNFTIEYDFNFNNFWIKSIKLNTIGLYQIDNSALALSVLCFLSIRDEFSINTDLIYKTMFESKFPGRVDLQNINDKYFIFDGAHNPQKMTALIKSLKKFFPNQKFTFLLAFKQRKDFAKMIKMIVPIADEIILTKFKVASDYMIQLSQSQLSLNQAFDKLRFYNFCYLPDKSKAFNYAKKTKYPTVVTGSLYLLSEIYPLIKSFK